MIADQQAIPDDLVELGYVTGAYGIRGWVKVEPFSAEAEALLVAKEWWLKKAKGGQLGMKPDVPGTAKASLRSIEVCAAKMHSGSVVAHPMGYEGRTLAETLKGYTVLVSRAKFPPLADDEYYWVDLVGLSVSNLQGEILGRVVGLMDNGVHPILRVADEQQIEGRQHERLIPFVGQYIQTVDIAGKRLVVDWALDY